MCKHNPELFLYRENIKYAKAKYYESLNTGL